MDDGVKFDIDMLLAFEQFIVDLEMIENKFQRDTDEWHCYRSAARQLLIEAMTKACATLSDAVIKRRQFDS